MEKKTAKAYILKSGEVVEANSYLERFVLKSEPKQLPPETFIDVRNPSNLVEPIYDQYRLAGLLELNSYHNRAVKTKAIDTAGSGWQLIPKNGNKNAGQKTQKKVVEDFLNTNGMDKFDTDALTEVLKRMLIDYEATGNGYLEIVRNSVEEVPEAITHIPSYTMKRHLDGVRYCQEVGAKKHYFKKVGLHEDVNLNTGEIVKENSLKPEERANEVIHFYNYTSRSDYYGIPDIIPALDALLGDTKRAEYVTTFFDNHAIPAYAVTVTGTDLDMDTQQQIKEFFQRDVKDSRHSTLVLSAEKDPNNPTAEPIEFKFQALSDNIRDASFQQYRKDNRDEILAAHGVPAYRVGVMETGSLGGNIAQESTDIYKMSIIEPRQRMVEDFFNRFILAAFGVTEWEFKFNEIDTKDEKHELDRVIKLVEAGLMSPNQARQELGYEVINDPHLDSFYFNGIELGTKGNVVNNNINQNNTGM